MKQLATCSNTSMNGAGTGATRSRLQVHARGGQWPKGSRGEVVLGRPGCLQESSSSQESSVSEGSGLYKPSDVRSKELRQKILEEKQIMGDVQPGACKACGVCMTPRKMWQRGCGGLWGRGERSGPQLGEGTGMQSSWGSPCTET